MKAGGTSPRWWRWPRSPISSPRPTGGHQESVASIAAAIEAESLDPGDADKAAVPLPLDFRLTLIDAYCRRLTQAGQFEVAGRRRGSSRRMPRTPSSRIPRRAA